MDLNRLKALGLDELCKMATQRGLDTAPHIDRESLINAIIEDMEDARMERESDENQMVQVEAKKYSVSDDQNMFDTYEKIDLPIRYNVNKLVLLPRDPSWAYCYWDIENKKLEKVFTMSNYQGLVLRINERFEPQWTTDIMVDYFDIPIHFRDLHQYVNLPHKNSTYSAEIYAKVGDKMNFLVRSNTIECPRDFVAQDDDQQTSWNDLLRMSGLSMDYSKLPGDFFVDSHEYHSPQRIYPYNMDEGSE